MPLFSMSFGVSLPSLFSPFHEQLCHFRLQSRPLQVVFNNPHPSSRWSTSTSLRIPNVHDVTCHMLLFAPYNMSVPSQTIFGELVSDVCNLKRSSDVLVSLVLRPRITSVSLSLLCEVFVLPFYAYSSNRTCTVKQV